MTDYNKQIVELIDDFSFFENWEDKYQYLIDLGRKVPKMDEKLKVDENKLNITVFLEDSEKFYVEKINIFGHFDTIEEVIRNNLKVDEGDPLNNVLYNKSIDQIRNLGFFNKVDSEVVNGSNENLKIINITVEEQPTGEITMGAGYGSSGSTLGAGIVEKNFLGKGINLNTNFELSEESLKGQFIFSKPNSSNVFSKLSIIP